MSAQHEPLLQPPGVFSGVGSLFYREVLRFWKVRVQTILSPALSSLLYLMIFGHVLDGRVTVFENVSYGAFLVPGLVMMGILQNAFANSASSLVQSKIIGGIVFLLLAPMSPLAWWLAYVGAAVFRGVLVGAGVWVATLFYAPPAFAQPVWIMVFALMGAGLMGTLGIIAGLWANKFDQMATFQNFVIMPMTFLSGIFYSVHSLPEFWSKVSQFNPIFYMVDGFRYGFFGQSDVNVWLSFSVVAAFWLLLSAIALHWLRTGRGVRG